MAYLLNFCGEFNKYVSQAVDTVPELIFGDVYAEIGDFNPNILGNRDYGLINGNVPLNMVNVSEGESKFTKELKQFYGTNDQRRLDHQLSYFDSQDSSLHHYCAPINIGNFHWVVLDVTMPNKTYDDGRVMINNHCHQNEEEEEEDKIAQSNYNTSYIAQMWAAKYFGIYHKDSTGVKPGSIYFGYGDMQIKQFSKKKFKKKSLLPPLITKVIWILLVDIKKMALTVVYGC